jgi:hypothetical protein
MGQQMVEQPPGRERKILVGLDFDGSCRLNQVERFGERFVHGRER